MAIPTRYTKKMIAEYMTKYWNNVPSLSQTVDKNAQDYPDKEAVVDSTTRVTWGQAKIWTDRVALGLLEMGIRRDEVTVAQLPPTVELYLFRIACEKAGILCAPVLRSFRHREMEYLLGYLEAKAVLIPWKYLDIDHFQMIQDIRPGLPKLKHIIVAGDEVPPGTISLKEVKEYPLARRYPPGYLEKTRHRADEISYINLTTGTTGFPKFVEYTTCARPLIAQAIIERMRISDKDVVAAYTGAAAGINIPAYYAAPQAVAKVVMLERFEPEAALRLIERENITVVCLVPAMLAMMLQCPNFNSYNYRSLRVWWVGGSPLAYHIAREAEEKMGGKVLNLYGAGDFGGNSVASLDDPPEVRMLTIGKPLGPTEIKLARDNGRRVPRGEVGEIWGRGPVCAAGYYKDRQGTRQRWGKFGKNGWLCLHDLAKINEQGNMVIMGRKDDMIIRGGQNIYPAEVEDALVTHPKIAAAAIVGLPDPILGEIACAYVVPKTGQQLTLDEMVSFLRQKAFASYKLPERLEIVDNLPMIGDGTKVDKKVLKKYQGLRS